MPIIDEDDWFETFEDAAGGNGILHVEADGSGLTVVAYDKTGGSRTTLKLHSADCAKLADLIDRKCPR
jgi:hypothetical protein